MSRRRVEKAPEFLSDVERRSWQAYQNARQHRENAEEQEMRLYQEWLDERLKAELSSDRETLTSAPVHAGGVDRLAYSATIPTDLARSVGISPNEETP